MANEHNRTPKPLTGPAAAPDLIKETGSLSLLCVEDDKMTREVLKRHLAGLFAKTMFAENGREGLSLYKTAGHPFDIIMTDVSMPEMDGLEMTGIIKEDNPEQCIIIISAHEDSHNLLRAIELGVDNFLIKPVYRNRLLEVLGKIAAAINRENKIKEYMKEIERKNTELEVAHQKIRENIEKARLIHRQLLPAELPTAKGVKLAAYNQPAEDIGGDFFNVIAIDGHLLFYLVDVSGHGLDGAILTVFVREAINSYLGSRGQGENPSPAELLTALSEKYCREKFPDDYFVCILIGMLNLNNMEFRYIDAGFQTPPLACPDWSAPPGESDMVCLEYGGLPVSAVTGTELLNKEEKVYNMGKCGLLVFTTDGLLEEDNGTEMFGEERLKEIIKNNRHREPDDIIKAVIDAFREFSGRNQGQDDITLLIVKT